MADSLPSPPSTPGVSTQEASDAAIEVGDVEQLDALLEQYLQALDEYTNLRSELSKLFSEGYLSLAQAQRSSSLGPGRRYGQDGYDGRMKASKRVTFTSTRDEQQQNEILTNRESINTSLDSHCDVDARISVALFNPVPVASSTSEKCRDLPPSEDNASTMEFSSANAEVSSPSASDEASNKGKRLKPDPAYRDPITWFGILVPQPLRQAQKSFNFSVERVIPGIISASKLLLGLERQIWNLREKLGIQEHHCNEVTANLAVRAISDKEA